MLELILKVALGFVIADQVVRGLAWLARRYREYEFERYIQTLAEYHEHLRRVHTQERED